MLTIPVIFVAPPFVFGGHGVHNDFQVFFFCLLKWLLNEWSVLGMHRMFGNKLFGRISEKTKYIAYI